MPPWPDVQAKPCLPCPVANLNAVQFFAYERTIGVVAYEFGLPLRQLIVGDGFSFICPVLHLV
jgi:hypothetical protein